MKKKALFMVCLCGFATVAAAQSAREEIRQNPALAAGKYYAYQAPETVLTPAPEGYEPFYISAFSRHGSRYLTKEKKYAEPLAVLQAADKAGVLTADGKRTLQVVSRLAAEAVDRMYARYPQVFQNGVHVDARSTYKTRAFLSMAAGCVELKGLNPELDITTNTSEADAYYIKYKNPKYEELHLANMDSVYQAADSVYIHPQRLMKQLFTDAAYVSRNISEPAKLMADLFELHGISQSSDNQPDLAFLFNDRELYDMWQRNNFEWYYEKGASPLSGACMYRLERNLLNSLTVATKDWQQIADTYRTYRIIPMCGNIQLLFYRKKGSEDILVKPLLNEREVTLPIPTDVAPYYHWKDLREYWKNVVDGIQLPQPTEE